MSGRREVLRNGFRAAGLAGLAGLATVLGLRSRRAKECREVRPCGGCPWFDGCGLPKARQERTGAR